MKIVVAGSTQKPEQEIVSLRARVDELEETLRAIQSGEVDALVVSTVSGDKVYTLENADQPYRLFVENMTDGAVTTTQTALFFIALLPFQQSSIYPLSRSLGTTSQNTPPNCSRTGDFPQKKHR